MKATESDKKYHRAEMRDEETTLKEQIKEVKENLRRGSFYAPKLVKAMKNYRCCGFNCIKIIKKGNRHFMKMPLHQGDSWWRACSIRCCANPTYVSDSSDIQLLKITEKHKIAKDLNPKKLGYRVLYN